MALPDDKVKYFYNQGLSKNAEVTGIQLEPRKETIELNVGDIYQLSAVIEPENAIDQTIMWKSDNISVASVDQNGKISAIAEGSAKITVSSNSDNAETSCFVYVSSENSGFKQNNDYSKIILYPNPVRNKIYLGLNEHSGITNYTIYNFTGRDLKRGTIMHHSRTIDVENLPNGLYFIEFQSDKTKNCIKFIIQN